VPLTAHAALLNSWQAVLRSPGPGGVDSLLTVVETNHFKQLTHLSLRLRPGHDAAVKQVGVLVSARKPAV
jgi:hypothetical protein